MQPASLRTMRAFAREPHELKTFTRFLQAVGETDGRSGRRARRTFGDSLAKWSSARSQRKAMPSTSMERESECKRSVT